MRLEVTRKSGLAIRALEVLAGESRRLKGQELAAQVESTAGFVSQVLTPLVRAGWVTSDPGPSGGYALTVELTDISVLAVIEAVEGPTPLDRCVLADKACDAAHRCALHTSWTRARTLLINELDHLSVRDAIVVTDAPI